MTTEERRLHALDQQADPSREAHDALETALFEVKRVIVGQEGMLERLLVALLAGGHVLLEGVPGLAKTLTVKTVADVLGGIVQAPAVHARTSCPPTSSARASTGRTRATFDTELGPVFCNFLLADEINRAPAKVQSALLEVMQEHQVTIGHDTHAGARSRSSCSRRRTRSSPRAPTRCPRRRSTASCSSSSSTTPTCRTRSRWSSARSTAATHVRQVLTPAALARHQRAAQAVYVDRRVMEYAVALTTATREPPARASRSGSSSAPARAARSTSSTPAARWPCCAGATTCCRRTCATSRATCCATASCSPTRRWPPASTPTACSTACSSACRCRGSSSRTTRSASAR